VATDPNILERRNPNMLRRIADLEAAHERAAHRPAAAVRGCPGNRTPRRIRV
jgi:hypothetical protein